MNVNNNRGPQVGAAATPAAARTARLKKVIDDLKAASQHGPLNTPHVEALLARLQPGDLSEQIAAVIMTRVQNKSWAPAELRSGANIDAKATPAFSALARALHNRLNPNAARRPNRDEYGIAEVTPSPRPAPGPRPAPPRSPSPVAEPRLYEMDPATRALMDALVHDEDVALSDHALALQLAAQFEADEAAERQAYESERNGLFSDGVVSQQEQDQQANLWAELSRRR